MKIEIEIYQKPSIAKGWYWKLYYFPIGIHNYILEIPLEAGGYCRTQKKAEKEARKTEQWIRRKYDGSKTNSYMLDIDG